MQIGTRHRRCYLTFETGGPGIVASYTGINPSTDDGEKRDQTTLKLIGFGLRLGIARWIVVNPFTLRSPDVKALRDHPDPVGPYADSYLRRAYREAELHIAGWGGTKKVPLRLRPRFDEVVRIAQECGVELHCLGRNKNGDPRHVLTTGYKTPLASWP